MERYTSWQRIVRQLRSINFHLPNRFLQLVQLYISGDIPIHEVMDCMNDVINENFARRGYKRERTPRTRAQKRKREEDMNDFQRYKEMNDADVMDRYYLLCPILSSLRSKCFVSSKTFTRLIKLYIDGTIPLKDIQKFLYKYRPKRFTLRDLVADDDETMAKMDT